MDCQDISIDPVQKDVECQEGKYAGRVLLVDIISFNAEKGIEIFLPIMLPV